MIGEYTRGYDFPFDRETADVNALRDVAQDVARSSTLRRDLNVDGRIWGALLNLKVTEFFDIGHDTVTSWFMLPRRRKATVGKAVGFAPTRSVDDMLSFCSTLCGDEAAMAALEAAAGAHRQEPLDTFPRRLFLSVMDAVVAKLSAEPDASPAPAP